MVVYEREVDLDPFVPDEEPVAVVIGWMEVDVVHHASPSSIDP